MEILFPHENSFMERSSHITLPPDPKAEKIPPGNVCMNLNNQYYM